MKDILTLFLLLATLNLNAPPPAVTLITDVKIFNGKSETLLTGHVLIENNLITKVSSTPIPVNRSATTTQCRHGYLLNTRDLFYSET